MIDYLNLIPQWSENIQQEKENYRNLENLVKLKGVTVILHNATWCPDCKRESVSLLAFLEANKELDIKLELISYEDRELYKANKRDGKLGIECLPTIIFSRLSNEIFRIEELASPNFKSLLTKMLKDS